MIVLLLALIGAIIVMAILTIGRLAFGRRETFVARKFWRWFISYSIFNYLLCLAIVYFSEPALTGPFGGWQWVLWPLVISSIGNLFAYARPALSTLEDLSAASQGFAERGLGAPTVGHYQRGRNRGRVAVYLLQNEGRVD